MKVSQALRIDPKVQRRYLQAQINDMGDKLFEALQKSQDLEQSLEHQDQFMRQFQDTLNDFQGQISKVKIDEKGFNEKAARIFQYFDDAKRDNQLFKDSIAESEKTLVAQKEQLIKTFERVQRETDAKFKRVKVIESQIQGLKQEIDVVRVKRVKDEGRYQQTFSEIKGKLTTVEKAIEVAETDA